MQNMLNSGGTGRAASYFIYLPMVSGNRTTTTIKVCLRQDAHHVDVLRAAFEAEILCKELETKGFGFCFYGECVSKGILP